MRSETEIRRIAERLDDEAHRAFLKPGGGNIDEKTEKAWRVARKRYAAKAQALRWVLGDEIEP